MSWPTWVRYRPEIMRQPLIVAMDDSVCEQDMDFLGPQRFFYNWDFPAAKSQKEKMLSAFVFLAPEVIQTPWMLKLDTDTIATQDSDRWCDFADEWAVLSHRLGFVPDNYLDGMDRWAEGTELNTAAPIPRDGKFLVEQSDRFTSWCMFARVDFLKWAASLCDRMPCDSQDLYHWYCAKRGGYPIRTLDMTQYGWRHGPIQETTQPKNLCYSGDVSWQS